ncbi:hypothetical protein PS007_24495, partial [Shigella sonnei]|nr:hypothetical protein [Shigella sonnei]
MDIYLTKYQQQYPDANALINTLHESCTISLPDSCKVFINALASGYCRSAYLLDNKEWQEKA